MTTDDVLVYLESPYQPARPIPEEEIKRAKDDPITSSWKLENLQYEYREHKCNGYLLAYKGIEKCNEGTQPAWEWEIEGCGNNLSDQEIEEDFRDFTKTGLYIWKGNIVYECQGCYDGPCDCGPSFNTEEVRPATLQDLKDLGVLIE